MLTPKLQKWRARQLMARVPDPVAGLVFRYGYVWLKDYLQKKIDPVKDRPACIIARVAEGGETGQLLPTGRNYSRAILSFCR
jgi:type IV secretory pathway protease TraF